MIFRSPYPHATIPRYRSASTSSQTFPSGKTNPHSSTAPLSTTENAGKPIMIDPEKEIRTLIKRTPPAQKLELALEMLGAACAALKTISREQPGLRIAVAILANQTITRLTDDKAEGACFGAAR